MSKVAVRPVAATNQTDGAITPENYRAVAQHLQSSEGRFLNDYELDFMKSVLSTSHPSVRQLAKLAKAVKDVADRKSGRYGSRHQRGYR